jgi:hypothetical protein
MSPSFEPGRLAVKYINYSRRTDGSPVLQASTFGVLLHSTEGHEGGDLPILTGATTQSGRADGVKASVHFYIPQEAGRRIIAFGSHTPGGVWTLWHAGQSEWQGVPGLNRYLIGIELEHVAGEAYTDAQMDSLYTLLDYLISLHAGSPYWRGWLLRHRDVAPQRKTDPTRPFDELEWPTLAAWWKGRHEGEKTMADETLQNLERLERVSQLADSYDKKADRALQQEIIRRLGGDPAVADPILEEKAAAVKAEKKRLGV